MTMTFQSALAALARIEAGTPQPEDVERVRGFVERVEALARSSEACIVNGLTERMFTGSVTLHGLRDVLRGSA